VTAIGAMMQAPFAQRLYKGLICTIPRHKPLLTRRITG
jgi:hypothetical protein